MNASQLWETTMDPETRTLIQVSIDDAAVVERNVTVLMGDKVEPRREWIEQNVQFTLEDNYQIQEVFMSDKKIVMNLEAIMGDRFGKYSKYIIQERALPECT